MGYSPWGCKESVSNEQLTLLLLHQGCILSPCLVNLYAEYILRHAGLDEHKLESRLLGEISNNLRCADTTTLMAESEEEPKSLLMKVKEDSEKAGLKQHSKN